MFHKTLAIAFLTLIGVSSHAATLSVTGMTFAGGTFQQLSYTLHPIPMAGSDNNLIGGYSTFGTQFDLADFPAMYFTGDGSMAPYGGMPVPGGPTPSATVDTLAGTIAVDMSSGPSTGTATTSIRVRPRSQAVGTPRPGFITSRGHIPSTRFSIQRPSTTP